MNAKRSRNWVLGVCVLAAVSFTIGQHVAAQERVIFVNGQRLNPQDIVTMDTLNCGVRVPNGSYWMDFQKRRWGAWNDPTGGELPTCSVPQPAPPPPPAQSDDCASRYRYFEDRMCHCYGKCGL